MKFVKALLLGAFAATASANQCVCEEGKIFQDTTYTCIEPTQKVENCVYYSSNNSCSVCASGFQVTTENKCEAVTTEIENCKYTRKGDAGSECFVCNKGYYIKSGKCEANPSTPENCQEYEWDGAVKCDECNEGYYKKSDGTCATNPTTDANCAEWNSESDCNKCKPTHYMDNTVDPKKCTELPAEFTAIDGCEHYKNSNGNATPVCEECKQFEYGKKDDSCKSCPYVYNPDGNSGAVLSASAVLLGALALLI